MSWFETLLSNCYGPLKCQPRIMIGAEKWNAVVDANPQGSWWHRYEWLDYCLAYKGGTDYSFAATVYGSIVALYPAIREGQTFALGGNPLVPALMVPEAPHESVGAAMTIGKGLVTVIARHHNIACADMMLPPTPKGPLKNGTVFAGDEETESIPFATRVIDLSLPEAERFAAVRKSYRQFINAGKRRAECLVDYDNQGSAYFKLHQEMYPGARSKDTYLLQAKFIEDGVAHSYVCHDATSVRGAVLWYVYKGMAYYASGAYREKNVAHPALWQSMGMLAAQGIKYAELGWQGRATDEKGKAVEFFKRGLGGTDWPVPCMRRLFLTHHQEAAS